VAAICTSHAQQPASDAPPANAKPIKSLGYIPEHNHTITLPNAVTVDLVWIDPGTFTMGEPCPDGAWQIGDPTSDESSPIAACPQTVVTISREFWLGKTPVTQGQYRAVMGSNPSNFVEAGVDAPVEQVSWDDAMDFCQKLTEQERAAGHLPEGYAYTLPTEAQWEYACRAGTTEERYTNLDKIAWYRDNSDHTTHPVAKRQPNSWGLYDMLGNVMEWCLDGYGIFPGGNVTDPTGPGWCPYGDYRVFRGCCWYQAARNWPSADRHGAEPGYRRSGLGFRLALGASQAPLPQGPATITQKTGEDYVTAPWAYNFHGTGPAGESITGALFYRGQFIPIHFYHVATPIGEFQICGRKGFGTPVYWAPAYRPQDELHSREIWLGDYEGRAKAILAGREGLMRTTKVKKNPPVVSNRPLIPGSFENRPIDAGADWFFVFDKNLWVDPGKIQEVESKLIEHPLYERNFSNMDVLERKAVCDKIRMQDHAAILQAWIDADRIEHDRGKHSMLGTTLSFAMHERPPSPESLVLLRAFIYDSANSELDREILITNLGYAQRKETTDLLLDMWAHPPADKELKNSLLASLGMVNAQLGHYGEHSDAASAILTEERVRPLLVPVHIAERIVEGFLFGLVSFLILRKRDKKLAMCALLVCTALGLSAGWVVAIAAAIVIVVFGLLRPARPETNFEENPRPPAMLGGASIATPVLAAGVTWIWLLNSALSPPPVNHTQSWGPVFPDGTLWIIGMLALASIIGTVLSICSLRKRERWPLMAAIGLMVNGVPCLYVIWFGLCLVARALMQR